jgi:Leucine-rich repeat (LRR) protein
MMSMCALEKLPSLKFLWVTVRSDWVVPHMDPVVALLLPKVHHAATHLDLSQTFWRLDRHNLEKLAPITSIQSLCLRNTGVDEGALQALVPLTAMSHLDIHGCAVGLHGWETLMTLPRLSLLDWSSNCLPSIFCPNLGQLNHNLTSLNLANTSLGDRSLSFLLKLTALQSLDLSITADCPFISKHGAWLSDNALRSVASLKSLSTLRLQNQYGITPEGVAQLKVLDSLTELDLSGCLSMFEGNDLHGVAALTGLRSLSLQAVNSSTGASSPHLLEPLQALTNLTQLDLSQNWGSLSLDGLAPLATLTKLRSLDLAPSRGQHCWLASKHAGTYSLDELMGLVSRGVGLMKGILVAERAREQAFGFTRPAILD